MPVTALNVQIEESEMKKFAVTSVIGIAALAFIGIAPTAASATDLDSPEPTTIKVANVPGGFDRSIAAAHGYEIRTTPTGKQYSVKVGTPAGTVSTQSTGTVAGDCGYSFVTLSPGTHRMASGFVVNGDVAFRKWGVTVQNGGIVYNFNMDGAASGASWSDYRAISWASGVTQATVNGGSFAALWNGQLCYSGIPHTTTVM